MRLMSFALTTEQVIKQTKTVTRRLGWLTLHPGILLQPVVKAQGLKKGEHPEAIGAAIRVVSVRRERLRAMNAETRYGLREAAREGFPHLTGKQFVAMFCKHMRVQPDAEVTRIEFEYTEPRY